MNQSWINVLPQFIKQRLEGRHALQKIIGNMGWLSADYAIRAIVGLIVGVWVARYLGPEQFGILSYAIAFVAIFSAIASMGLDSIVVRNIVRTSALAEEILGSTFVLKLIGGTIAFVLAVIIIFVLRSGDMLTCIVVSIIAAGMIFQAFDTIDLWFQSQIKSKYTVYAKNVAFLLASSGKVVLILTGAHLMAFAGIILFEAVVGAVGLMAAYGIQGQFLSKWRISPKRGFELINDSWPLIFTGLAIYVQARIDQVMLGEIIGLDEVGQYSVAMNLIEVFGFIPMLIYISVAPAVTEAKLRGEKEFYERLLNIYRLMFILFILTAVPIFFFANQIVAGFFGVKYSPAGTLLGLFSIRLFFTNFGVAKSLFIANENLFRYSLVTAVVGTLVNVILNYVLIPKYASIGAIWATIASFTATIFVVDIFYPKMEKNLRTMLLAIATPWRLKIA